MALSREIAETILVKRLGPLMAVAEMSVDMVGTNADLNDPLAWATRGVGGTTATYSTVTDAELALVSDLDDLLVLAEWRTLKNIQGALNTVDLTVGPMEENLSQYAEKVQQMLDNLEPLIEGLGVLAVPMTAGYISLSFAEHD